MKSIITKQNYSSIEIQAAFKNKDGIIFSNDELVRKAIAEEADRILRKLRSSK